MDDCQNLDEPDGFALVTPPSEPYSPGDSFAETDEAESISSISETSERPVLGKELTSSDEEMEAQVAAPIVGEGMAQSLDEHITAVVFRHVISGCCHVARDGNADPDDGESTVLRCGKLATKNFEQVDLAGNFLPYKCARCFAGS